MRTNWHRLATLLVVALALTVVGGKCGKKPPEIPDVPAGPAETFQRGYTSFKAKTTSASGDVRFVMSWGDNKIDTTSSSYASGAEATVRHAWADTGTFYVKAMAILDADPSKASEWSDSASVHVLPNDAPAVPVMQVPLVGVINVKTFFSAVTTDPNGDSVSYKFDFGDGEGDWTGFVASGVPGRDSHVYTSIETVQVRCQAQDIHEAESDWSDAKTLYIGEAGGVKWWWIDSGEDEGVCYTSALIVVDGENELAYSSADDGSFYGIRVTDGARKRSGQAVQPLEQNEFTGHPAYCAATGHVIVGNEDGELYAMNVGLSKAWHWPGQTHEDSLTYIEWGTPAINGSKIYVPRDNDTLYYFTDLGSDGRLENTYYVPGIVDAPVIDASGYVLFGTDSGYIYKMRPDLTLEWRKLLKANDDIHSPAIGPDGTVYCGSSTGWVYAVNPDGSVKWSKQLGGETYRVVVVGTVAFVTTGQGRLYKLDTATGNITWNKQYATTEITTSAIIAGDYLYYQDFDDVVFCVQQSDGALLWKCDCLLYGPAKKSGPRKLDGFEGNPSITSTGDIIVIGAEAMYCVAGYASRTLPGTGWPKWQKDLYNTGKTSAW